MKKVLVAVEILCLFILVAYVPLVQNPSIMLTMPKIVWYGVYVIGSIVILITVILAVKAMIMGIKWLKTRYQEKITK